MMCSVVSPRRGLPSRDGHLVWRDSEGVDPARSAPFARSGRVWRCSVDRARIRAADPGGAPNV